jgi:hypothetical protein
MNAAAINCSYPVALYDARSNRSNVMGVALPLDERFSSRHVVVKGAAILNGVEGCEIRCFIRDMHERGAELRVGREERIPAKFLLYVPRDGVTYRAALSWRDGDRAGVDFSGTEPRPHGHYG